MVSRWRCAPKPLRVSVAAIVLVLAYGTAVHLFQLVTSGFNPYPELPGWLRSYFVALVVADPLAAVLLARRRPSGVALTVGVFVSDAATNWWANYLFDSTEGVTTGRVSQAVITLLALGVCAIAPRLWRASHQPASLLS